MKPTVQAALAVLLLTFAPFAVHAQVTINPSSSLVGDDPDGTFSGFGDAFGAGADTWQDWLFIGSPRETMFRDGDDFLDGAVYIYRRDVGGNYVFWQKLTMPGNSGLAGNGLPIGDRLGGAIEAAGGWLFIGAANDQDFPGQTDPRQGLFDPADPAFQFAGQVHVYQLQEGSWQFVQTLISPTPGSFGSFGTRSQASHIALNDSGRLAVIGEPNNFDGGAGQLHTYRPTRGQWELVQTIDTPTAAVDFGDDLVFANERCLAVSGAEIFDDGLTAQGFVFTYQAKGYSGTFFTTPSQTIAGPVDQLSICPTGFGQDGLDAGGGVVAVADACAEDSDGFRTGNVSVYRRADLAGPNCSTLSLEQTIPGDVSELSFGNNAFGSRHAIAVSGSGGRILIGTPLAPLGFLDFGSIGDDVRVYAFDGTSWINESRLTTLSPATAIFRTFGDTVFFIDDETALVRENNFIDPPVSGLKGQTFLYDLTP